MRKQAQETFKERMFFIVAYKLFKKTVECLDKAIETGEYHIFDFRSDIFDS